MSNNKNIMSYPTLQAYEGSKKDIMSNQKFISKAHEQSQAQFLGL
jgi:hypothetical protein